MVEQLRFLEQESCDMGILSRCKGRQRPGPSPILSPMSLQVRDFRTRRGTTCSTASRLMDKADFDEENCPSSRRTHERHTKPAHRPQLHDPVLAPFAPKEKSRLKRGKSLPGKQRLADVPLGQWALDGVVFPPLPPRRFVRSDLWPNVRACGIDFGAAIQDFLKSRKTG